MGIELCVPRIELSRNQSARLIISI